MSQLKSRSRWYALRLSCGCMRLKRAVPDMMPVHRAGSANVCFRVRRGQRHGSNGLVTVDGYEEA